MKIIKKLLLLVLVLLPCALVMTACGGDGGGEGRDENVQTYTLSMPEAGEGYSFDVHGKELGADNKYLVMSNNSFCSFSLQIKAGYDFEGEPEVKINGVSYNSDAGYGDTGILNFKTNRTYNFSAEIMQNTEIELVTAIVRKELTVNIATSDDYIIKKVNEDYTSGDVVGADNSLVKCLYGDVLMLDYKTTDPTKSLTIDDDNDYSQFIAIEEFNNLPDVNAVPVLTNDGKIFDYDGFTRIRFIVKDNFSTDVPEPKLNIHQITYPSTTVATINSYLPSRDSFIIDEGEMVEVEGRMQELRSRNEVRNGGTLYFGIELAPTHINSLSTLSASYKTEGGNTFENAVFEQQITNSSNSIISIYKIESVNSDTTIYLNGVDLSNKFFEINFPEDINVDIHLVNNANKAGIIYEINGKTFIKKGINYEVEFKLSDTGYSKDSVNNPTITITGLEETTVKTAQAIITNQDSSMSIADYNYKITITADDLKDFDCDVLDMSITDIVKNVCSITLVDEEKEHYTLFKITNYNDYMNGAEAIVEPVTLENFVFKQKTNTTEYYFVKPNDGYYFHNCHVTNSIAEIIKDDNGFLYVVDSGEYTNSLILKLSILPSSTEEALGIIGNFTNYLICDNMETEEVVETDLVLTAPKSTNSDMIEEEYLLIRLFGLGVTPSETLTLSAADYYNKEFYITLHNSARIDKAQILINSSNNFDLYLSWKPDKDSPLCRVKLERGKGEYTNAFKVDGLKANMFLTVDFISLGLNARAANDVYVFSKTYTVSDVISRDENLFKNTTISLGLNTYADSKMIPIDFKNNNTFEFIGAGVQDILYIKVTANEGYLLNDIKLATNNTANSTGLHYVAGGSADGYVVYSITNTDDRTQSRERKIYSVINNNEEFNVANIISAVSSDSPNAVIEVKFNDSCAQIEFSPHNNPNTEMDDDSGIWNATQNYVYGDVCKFKLSHDTFKPYNFENAEVHISTQSEALEPDEDGYYSFEVKCVTTGITYPTITIYFTNVTTYDQPCKIDVSGLKKVVEDLIVSFNDDLEENMMGGGKTPILSEGTDVYYSNPNGYISLFIKRSPKYDYSTSMINVNGVEVAWPLEPNINNEYYQINFNIAQSLNGMENLTIQLVKYSLAQYKVTFADFEGVTVEYWNTNTNSYVEKSVSNEIFYDGSELKIRVSNDSLNSKLVAYFNNDISGIQNWKFRPRVDSTTGMPLESADGKVELILDGPYKAIYVALLDSSIVDIENALR